MHTHSKLFIDPYVYHGDLIPSALEKELHQWIWQDWGNTARADMADWVGLSIMNILRNTVSRKPAVSLPLRLFPANTTLFFVYKPSTSKKMTLNFVNIMEVFNPNTTNMQYFKLQAT